MKKLFTLRFIAGRQRKAFLAVAGLLLILAVTFISCYKFRSINQPTDGFTNSYFDVPIVCQRDDDPSLGDDEWSITLQNIGLFGVMIPNGWTVKDSIPYQIICKDPSLNNSGFLIHNLANSKTLKDSIPPLPGYYWWGAVTDRIAELTQLDSFYFTPRIITNGITGNFNLRYAVGDKDYWDRNPADRYNYGGGLSDMIPISITSGVGVAELLSSANISLYPNPTAGIIHVKFRGYKSEVIQMNLINSSGQKVRSYEIFQAENEFDISDLPKGVYVVQLLNGKLSHSSRIILK
jgi:hypothetical protein